MKKKVIISIVMLSVLIAAIVTMVCINQKNGNHKKLQSFNTAEEMNEATGIPIEYSNRLCGVPVTGYEANQSEVMIHYGEAGFIRKAMNTTENGDKPEDSAFTQQQVNGRTVYFKEKGGKVFAAEWNDNNFDYTISVTEGVDAAEMAEYIEATR